MVELKRLVCGLLLIGVAAVMVHSQQTASEYVAPSEAVPRGKAPRMQVQLLNPGDQTKQYAVIFYQGDEAFSGLQEFADKYHDYECALHRDWCGERSDLGVVRSPAQNVQEDSHRRSARSDRDER